MGKAAVAVEDGIFRIQPDGLSEVDDRLVEIVLLIIGIAAATIGINCDGPGRLDSFRGE